MGIIDNELQQINTAIYGEEMRKAIHDGLDKLEKYSSETSFLVAAKTALLNLLQHVAYTDDQGQTYYNALALVLYGDEITSLTAVYSPGTFKVHEGDSLDVLRPYLTVTANHSSGATETVQSYQLSGTLVEGSQTITVSYNGKTTTFTVIVEPRPIVLYNLESPIVMDGVDTTKIVNTGVYIAREDIDFTIMVEFTSNNPDAWSMLFFDMDTVSPWPGYSFTVTDASTNKSFRFIDNVAEYWFAGVNSGSDIVRFVYSHQVNGPIYARLSVNGTERQLTDWIQRTISQTAINKPLILGGSISNDMTEMGDPWKGTIRKATVLNSAISESEITEYLTAGILG